MLVRTRPYRPAVAIRSFDQSFDRVFEQLTSSFTTTPRTPVVDATWRDGDLVLTVDGEPYPLGAGDSATFDADLPHNLHNPGETTAEILAVIAAGLRRS